MRLLFKVQILPVWTEHCLAPPKLFQRRNSFEEISNKRYETSVVPTKHNPMDVTYLTRRCQNTARRLTHHCWIKEDKNSWSQEACWSQNNYIINHAQYGDNGSSGQQAAHGGGLKHPLPVVGAQVDELGDMESSEWPSCLRRRLQDKVGT